MTLPAMKLLAFETATEACSVAVWIDGEVIERFEIAPRRHAELALPWADAVLAEAGIAKSAIDAIAVGRGPGAFTGVRLAIAVAQGVALALDRPIVPVSTLAALALQGGAPRVLAAIDARMGEVYAAAFRCDNGDAVLRDAERVVAPDRVVLPDQVRHERPDVILASWCGKKVRKATITGRPGWGDLPAVRDGRIYEVKSTYILQPGPASLTEGVRQLHTLLARVHGLEIDPALAPHEPFDGSFATKDTMDINVRPD